MPPTPPRLLRLRTEAVNRHYAHYRRPFSPFRKYRIRTILRIGFGSDADNGAPDGSALYAGCAELHVTPAND